MNARCQQQAVVRVGDLYKLDPSCQTGTVNLRVELTYSSNWRGRLGAESARTPLYTRNGPQISSGADGYYSVEFDGDKTVCFAARDNQGIKWGRGLNNTVLRCHVVRFRGPPLFERHLSRTLDSPFLGVDANGLGYGGKTLQALVGKELVVSVRARDPNPEDRVTIVQNEDPGIPTGAVLEAGVCVEHGMVSDKSGVVGAQVRYLCGGAQGCAK